MTYDQHNPTMDPANGRAPTNQESNEIVEIKSLYENLHRHLSLELPDSREKSLALTHLEDSCMRATRAVFRD